MSFLQRSLLRVVRFGRDTGERREESERERERGRGGALGVLVCCVEVL